MRIKGWPQRSYDHAMTLRGTMSIGEAAEQTGIPYSTIQKWWSGKQVAGRARGKGSAPPQRCCRGHEFTPENTRVQPDGRRSCKRCQREVHDRTYHYRSRVHRFHPKWNPDKSLAPVEELWLPSAAVVGLIHDHVEEERVAAQLSKHGSGLRDKYYRLKKKRSPWVCYVRAEEMLTALGLSPAMLDVEPVHSGVRPPA